MMLNPTEISQMSPAELLNFLLANYKKTKIKAEGDTMPMISAISIGGIINIAEFRYLDGGHPSYDISVFDKDINNLSDAEAAMTVLNGKQLYTIFKQSEAIPGSGIITDNELWNLANKLYQGCQEQLGINPQTQSKSKLEQTQSTQKSKTKKIYTRGLVTYMVAVLIMFAAFESGLYISKKNYNKSINEIHNRVQKQMQHDCDSICDAAQNKLDSLNNAIAVRQAALDAMNNKKQQQKLK